MFPFKHLPVTSEQAATQNFEQLRVLLPTTQGTLDERYLQQSEATAKYLQTATASRKAAFGEAKLKWPVKSAESATLEVVTGLASISSVTGTLVATFGYLTVLSVAGGTVSWKALANGELVAGTERGVYWVAVGT